MNINWLIHAKRWAQNPPSWGRILLIFGVIAACIAIYAIERALGGGDGEVFNWRRPRF
jgi:hypothetical protein